MALDVDHLRARHHHLSREGVTELEHGVDHLTLIVLDEVFSLREVHELAQFRLGREGTLAVATTGGEGVAQDDEERGQRSEDAREQAGRPRRAQRDAIRMLAPQGAGGDAENDVVDDHHQCDNDEQREPHGPPAHLLEGGDTDVGHQSDRGDRSHGRQEEQDVHVAGPVGDDVEQSRAPPHALALEVLDSPARDTTDSRLGHDEKRGDHDEDDRDDHEEEVGRHPDTSSQPWSNSACSANMRSCSSGSA